MQENPNIALFVVCLMQREPSSYSVDLGISLQNTRPRFISPLCISLLFWQMKSGLANLGSDLRASLGAIDAAAAVELAGVRSEVQGVKRDLASVRASVEKCRAENMEFFESFFTASLKATQQGIEIMRVRAIVEVV